MKTKILNTLTALLLLMPVIALASNGQANNISSIDGDGNGVYNNTLVHASGPDADHLWYTFCATSGSTVTLQMSSPTFNTYLWVYDVLDDNAEVGDAINADYTYEVGGGGSTAFSIDFDAPANSQYIVQVDSYNGDSGDFTLTISGACGSLEAKSIPTLSNWSIILMLGSILAFAAFRLRQ